MHMKKVLFSLFLLVTFSAAKAQVSLAPTAIFLDKNGMGSLYITNSSDVAQEISVSFQFGYTFQDDFGGLKMFFDDSVRAKTNGLDGMIKAFPRTFNLPAKQQQLVRFQVRAPKDLPDGMYFTRVRVGSSGQVSDVGTSGNDGGINTRVNVRFEQVIAAFFKKGTVTTGITVDKLGSEVDSNFISLMVNYRTIGNAPFLGRVKMAIKNPEGKVVAEGSQTIAMYFSGLRRMNLRAEENLTSGRYEVELTYDTSRSDISSEDLVSAKPYTYKGYIQVP